MSTRQRVQESRIEIFQIARPIQESWVRCVLEGLLVEPQIRFVQGKNYPGQEEVDDRCSTAHKIVATVAHLLKKHELIKNTILAQEILAVCWCRYTQFQVSIILNMQNESCSGRTDDLVDLNRRGRYINRL